MGSPILIFEATDAAPCKLGPSITVLPVDINFACMVDLLLTISTNMPALLVAPL